MDESQAGKRGALRRRILKGGKITFHYHGAAIDCCVRNLSERGACLQVESPVGIPNEFDLFIESAQVLKRCRVAWRADKRIGVAFRPDDAA